MRFAFNILLLFLTLYSFGENRDSLNSHHLKEFYLLISEHVGLGNAWSNIVGKYEYESLRRYEIERMQFSFRSPAIGAGYVLKKKRRMLKTEMAYFIGVKNLKSVYHSNSETIDAPVFANFVDPQRFSSNPNYYIGKKYYKFTDSLTGSLYLHYLDFNVHYGRNLGKYFSVITGPRFNFLLGSKYDGQLKRKADEYLITGVNYNSGIIQIKESYLSTQNLFFEKKEFKKRSGKYLTGNFYWSLGFNIHTVISERTVFFSSVFDFYLPIYSYSRKSYVSFSICYFFDK